MKPRIRTFNDSALGKYHIAKSKKEQLAEDRFTEIERANRILLEKMSNIFNDKGIPGGQRKISFSRRSLNYKVRRG